MQEEDKSHGDTTTNGANCFSSCGGCLFTIFHRCCRHKDIVILLIGLDNAGKSTLISTLKKEEKQNETPIWGFDKKEWNSQTFRVSLYDLGGGKSIRGLWPHYYAEAYGAIFVVDGADEYRLWEASKELKIAMKHPRLAKKPFLVVANKLNEGTALHYDDLMGALGPFNTNDQAFIYCDCRLQHGSVMHRDLQLGLDWLLASIKFRFEELQERVTFERIKQRDEEQRSLEERRQRSKSYLEEKEAASQLPLVVFPNLEDGESEEHARMETWIGPDQNNPTYCTYERHSNQGKSFQITSSEFDISLQPLIKQYEKHFDELVYTPSQIAEYFGDFIDKPNNIDENPHLPGQPNLTTNL